MTNASSGIILVTGANGQLGQELRDLSKDFPGFRFHFYDRESLPLDVPERLAAAFEEVGPHICINAAAYTAVDKAESEKEQAFAVNAAAAGHLGALCKKTGALLLHVSTDYVFNGQGTRPYLETDPVDPLGVYGASKLEGERQAFQSGDRVVVVRTSWVYSSYGKNFVKTMLRLMGDKESIGVVSDQVGRPTYAADLATALMAMVTRYSSMSREMQMSDPRFRDVYHFADRGEISWFDLASAIARSIRSKCVVRPIATTDYPTPAKRPAYSVLDSGKMERVFGLSIPDWKESLQRCLERLGAV